MASRFLHLKTLNVILETHLNFRFSCCTCVIVDGGWTQWSSWSSCPKTCGVGSHTRTRTCTNPAPEGGGADCVGPANRTTSCNIILCPGT